MSVLSDMALAYWKLNEAFDNLTGLPPTAVDSSLRGNDLNNGGNMEHDSGVCTGIAAHFHPGQLSSSLVRGSTTDLALGDFDFEFTGWMYTGNAANGGPILAKALNFPAASDYEIFYTGDTSTRELIWTLRNTANTSSVSATWGSALATLRWYFVDVYYDAGANTLGISVDRGTFVTASLSGGPRVTAGDFALGRMPGVGSYHFNDGRMSNWGLWSGLLSEAQRDYLAGLTNANCPPDWPFTDSPGVGIAFEGYIARVQDAQDFTVPTYGPKTYFIIPNPIVNRNYAVAKAMVSIDGMKAGEKINLKMQRDGDDPNDPYTGRCTLTNVAVDYNTLLPS